MLGLGLGLGFGLGLGSSGNQSESFKGPDAIATEMEAPRFICSHADQYMLNMTLMYFLQGSACCITSDTSLQSLPLTLKYKGIVFSLAKFLSPPLFLTLLSRSPPRVLNQRRAVKCVQPCLNVLALSLSALPLPFIEGHSIPEPSSLP